MEPRDYYREGHPLVEALKAVEWHTRLFWRCRTDSTDSTDPYERARAMKELVQEIREEATLFRDLFDAVVEATKGAEQ